MAEFMALWLPILVSAVAVWIASAIVWMAMPHHKKDYIELPDEKGFTAFLKSQNIPAGVYGFPDCKTPEKRNSPEMKEAWQHGPMGMLYVWKTPMSMGGKMFATFLVFLCASAGIGYLASIAITGSPEGMHVFRIVATAGTLTYCFSFIPNMIWFGAYRRTIVANIVDGIAYGVITGLVFMWMWPGK
ncbi:MAG: hypothetical protein IT435_03190 [Phycisphaerales bacterium]|nr:hypothetical protein [Phycisphaerales bacterium]